MYCYPGLRHPGTFVSTEADRKLYEYRQNLKRLVNYNNKRLEHDRKR